MPLLLLVRFLQHGIYQLCRFIRLGCAALRFRKFLCGFLAAAAFDFTLNAAHINRCKLKTLKNAVDLACILRSNHHIRNTVISIPVLQHAVQHTILLGCLAKLLQISVLHSKDFQFFAASQHIRQPRLTLGLFLFTQNGIQKNSDLFRACTGDFGGNFSPFQRHSHDLFCRVARITHAHLAPFVPVSSVYSAVPTSLALVRNALRFHYIKPPPFASL